MTKDIDVSLSCPAPIDPKDLIRLAHGGGGRLMHNLIDQIIAPHFGGNAILEGHDSATVDLGASRCAFTTDSYVVKPLFFPGGDIGSLAVNGTVNDLAMVGAEPICLSVGFILEEGFSLETLNQIAASMRDAADFAGVSLVTGDTKVVEQGKGDGLFINTSGLGLIPGDLKVGPRYIQPGDAILLNGDIARHGMAVMIAREDLGFETMIESDTAPLAGPVQCLIKAGIDIHCMRDLTRGGLASATVELAETSGEGIILDEASIPVHPNVATACELLGFDPIHVANEGRFIAFVAQKDAEAALKVLREEPSCSGTQIIGQVADDCSARVTMTSLVGGSRVVDMLSGEQLPRIC